MEEEAAIEVGVLTENHHSDGMAKDIIDSDEYQFKSLLIHNSLSMCIFI